MFTDVLFTFLFISDFICKDTNYLHTTQKGVTYSNMKGKWDVMVVAQLLPVECAQEQPKRLRACCRDRRLLKNAF